MIAYLRSEVKQANNKVCNTELRLSQVSQKVRLVCHFLCVVLVQEVSKAYCCFHNTVLEQRYTSPGQVRKP